VDYKKLAELFLDWNSKINLSSFNTLEEVNVKHIEDSLKLNDYFDLNKKTVLDVGTGGGFPLLPLAMSNPKASFTGIDSVHKKLKVIDDIAMQLKIDNIELIHARVEELALDKSYRENFDIVISRAFAKWPINLEMCLPFVKLDGLFIAYQGSNVFDFIEKYPNLEEKFGAKIIQKIEYEIASSKHYFVVLKKFKHTNPKYPRGLKSLKKLYNL